MLDKAVLEMIMAQEPLLSVLERLCTRIEERAPGLLCSTLLLDQHKGVFCQAAGPSLPRSYLDALNGLRIGPQCGSCGTAAYERRTVIVSDITTDPLWRDYKHVALSHGLRACWSVPIASHDNQVLGTFACYYREPGFPGTEQMQLIERASHLAGIAIENHRARTELRVAETRYRTLVERLPAITYIAEIGIRGPWHYVSPQIESMLGFSPKEWMANPELWIERVHEEDREIAIAAEKRIQETGDLYKAEYRVRARDGRILWFRDEAKLLDSATNEPQVMQGVLYDITEHKRLEDQLRQAQKMEAIGQLAGGVAHDFNNLLMVMQAHTDRIRDNLTSGDPLYADAEEVHSAVTKAASLVAQLLAFSRKQLLQPKVLDVSVVLKDVGKMLARVLEANIDFRIETQPNLARVKADQGQLEQAILNLAVNARDAMPAGGMLVLEAHNCSFERSHTWQHSSLDPGDYVVLSITDTGTGMNAETQRRVFEPFFTTKSPGKGTGLGLSMVYGVVKQSGGAISVSSELGKGTTFKIFLPKCDVQAPQLQSRTAAPRVVSGNETILLVEDQEAIREVTSEYLMRRGFQVFAAPDGEAALRIAETHQVEIDLLVTDVIMPNMGGRELAVRLTALHPNAKVLFMSGYSDDALRTHKGFTEHAEVLQKPFSLPTLASKARELLDDHD
jgi:two-component system cell cycle sensor histidine kinase/response regulator CckA